MTKMKKTLYPVIIKLVIVGKVGVTKDFRYEGSNKANLNIDPKGTSLITDSINVIETNAVYLNHVVSKEQTNTHKFR